VPGDRTPEGTADPALASWLAALEARHLRDLTFAETARALRALSSTYVERRERLRQGAALSGAGKRAAFALFYGPLHYLLVRQVIASLPDAAAGAPDLVDLGCGTGAAGAAWAAQCHVRPRLLGIDRHPWALEEAVQTYKLFGISARTRLADFSTIAWPHGSVSLIAGFAINELSDAARDRLLPRLLDRANQGDSVLIVEPVAGSVAPWWDHWAAAFQDIGGQADVWRATLPLPPLVEKLDRAAGLNHQELKARSLFVRRRR